MARRVFKRENGVNAAAWFNAQSFHHLPNGDAQAGLRARALPPTLIESTDCEFCDRAVEHRELECVLGHGVNEPSYAAAEKRAGLLHDRIHPTSGKLITSKPVKTKGK